VATLCKKKGEYCGFLYNRALDTYSASCPHPFRFLVPGDSGRGNNPDNPGQTPIFLSVSSQSRKVGVCPYFLSILFWIHLHTKFLFHKPNLPNIQSDIEQQLLTFFYCFPVPFIKAL